MECSFANSLDGFVVGPVLGHCDLLVLVNISPLGVASSYGDLTSVECVLMSWLRFRHAGLLQTVGHS